jgi:hypothetical protein
VVVNGGGGAIFNRGGLVNATNCIFTGNSGLGFVYSGPPKEAHGGAILNQGGQVNLENCVFAGNQAWGSMGTMNVDWGGDGIGGAVENSGILSLNRCTFVRNSAKGGDGWDSSRYANGAAGLSGGTGKGGAIFNSGSLAIANSSFFSNSVAGGKGGGGAGGAVGYYPPWQDGGPGGAGASGGSAYGADLFNQGAASAVNSTFAWNTASAGAGGAGGYGGRALLHGDPAPAGGPGGNGGSAFGTIYGGAFLGNCTLAFNSATNGAAGAGGGGGIGNGVPNGPTGGSGTAGLAGGGLADAVCRNTILASNVPGGNCRGGNSDQGNNLSSDAACSFSGAGSLNNVDPKLGALANNGGPTLTLALLPGSPAIDAGNTASAPATDQRGFPRPAGAAADIGAFEYGSVMPTLNLSQSSATALDLLVRGNSNQWCRVLTSTNLRDWICVATNQIGGEGTLLLHDSCASGKACMYYRLIMP